MKRNRFMFWRRRADATAPPADGAGAATTGAPTAAPAPIRPVGRVRVPRTRGVMAGLTIFVLGIWGGIVPVIGPYFHYRFINHQPWHWTTGRLWLDVIPGAVAMLAGLELMRTANRVTGVFAGWLAAAAGTWFIVGQTVSTLWNHGVSQAGRPLGSTFLRMIEQLGYFYALGAAILFLAALALGRMTVVSAREAAVAYSRSRDLHAAEAGEPAAVRRREPVAH